MLVHSATAPTAVLRTLPALRDDLWAPSAAAAWTAAAALTVIYAPADPAPAAELPRPRPVRWRPRRSSPARSIMATST